MFRHVQTKIIVESLLSPNLLCEIGDYLKEIWIDGRKEGGKGGGKHISNQACVYLYQVEEREAQVQELQDTITELHQEMTRKDQDKLTQLQELHQLESRVKQLTDQVGLRIYYHLDRSSSGLANSVGKHLSTSGQDQIELVHQHVNLI
jgi:TolA-binding protein